MAIDTLPPLRDVIERHDLAAKKSLGQNFLFDLNLTAKIARSAGDLDGVTVVEVGPGPGGLTRALLAGGAKRVIGIERDERCLPALAEIAAHYPGRLDIISADALTIDWNSLGIEGPCRIIANLPYNIGTLLLTRWIGGESWPPPFEAFVLMFNFEATCQIQISAQSGGPLVHVNPAITAGVAAMLEADGGKVGGDFAWPAMLRKVERLDPSYKT